MPFDNDALPVEKLVELFCYDAETGKIFWRVKSASKVRVGSEAGCNKGTRTMRDGNKVAYRYIRALGKSMSAPRVAWALHYGEWPAGKLYFEDENPLNLRIKNLRMSNSLDVAYDHDDPGAHADYQRAIRDTFPMDWKDAHLKSKFGITLGEYGQMLIAQGGKCAICNCEETHVRGGKVKALAVDHDHATGKVRALLCHECNQALGKVKENRDTLIAMIKYLDKHSGREVMTPALTLVSTEDSAK